MYDDVAAYEASDGVFAADIPYWERLVDELKPHRILELACGTGRILEPVARRGLTVDPGCRIVGLDLSAPFVARARERIGAFPGLAAATTVVEGDMTAFELDDRFDLVIVGYNSLAFVVGLDPQLRCLEAIRRHLAPGGRLAIDLVVPNAAALGGWERTTGDRLTLDHADPIPGVRRLIRYEHDRYDPIRQVDQTLYHDEIYLADGEVQRRTADLTWQMVYPRELELMFRVTGFRVVSRWGDYARQPFELGSGQYLWVAEAA